MLCSLLESFFILGAATLVEIVVVLVASSSPKLPSAGMLCTFDRFLLELMYLSI